MDPAVISDRRQRLRATLRLHLAGGVGAILFWRIVRAFGDVVQAAGAGPAGWRGVEGVGAKTAAAIGEVSDARIDEELEAAERAGARILLHDEDDYPAALRHIPDPPPLLYVRGRLESADATAVGIVGSRRCTHYGLEQADRFAQLLGRAGFSVISGGARGIDTAAHRGALTVGGRTVAVMGCGLNHCYPAENQRLFERIVETDSGALISELPMNTAVLRGNFPTRNRIISGLSLGILVVEAARRSGAAITARLALEQGREVFAVPGRVDSPMSQGANELIRTQSAALVQNLDDVLEQLDEVGRRMAPEPQPEAAAPPNLSETEQALFDLLGERARGLDELIRDSGLGGGEVTGAMTMLVLKGAVEQRPGNVFAVRRRRG
jgi:DNA processing protein